MRIEKVKSPDIDLSNLEKYLFNTIFTIILLFIFSASYYMRIPALREFSNNAMIFSYIMLGFLMLARVLSYQKKCTLFFDEASNLWHFHKGNRKISFEINEISSITKSYRGIYSSILLKIKDEKKEVHKIRIPAELPDLTEFMASLSEHLSKEQLSSFLKFHQESVAVDSEMEKASKFMQFFIFSVPLIAFFIAQYVWESFALAIGILWIILSMVFPILWTAIHLFLLKIASANFSVFPKITSLWAFFGILLYMISGIAYQKFYLWVLHLQFR